MLHAYMRRVQRLLRDQRSQIINPGDIIDYVNEARTQLAGESECIRVMGSLALLETQNVYLFSAIDLPAAATSGGVQGIFNIRTAWYGVGTGQMWLRPRPFEWFSLYELNSPVPASGPPKIWSQFGQGTTGSLYVAPLPDTDYTLPLDCVGLPVDLVDNTTPEAIPPLWTQAIPFYAVYLAMMSMETGNDTAGSDKMFAIYQKYVSRARQFSTPSVLPTLYPQIPSPVRANQLGTQTGGS